MISREPKLTEIELDSALDRLMAPAPSELLVHRVLAMAPRRAVRSPRLRRYAVAAVLALAVALAALVDISLNRGPSVAHLYDPPGGASPPYTAINDQPARATGLTGTISVASLPLE